MLRTVPAPQSRPETGPVFLASDLNPHEATPGGRPQPAGNADYRDIVRASLILDARYMTLLLPVRYRTTSGGREHAIHAYERTRNRLDAIYAFQRLKLPFEGSCSLDTYRPLQRTAKGSSATPRAWLAVFKSVRNSLSGSVATWASSGRAHHVSQDHPVYIPGDLNCSASRRQRRCRAGRPGGLCEMGETGSQPGTPDRVASQPVRRCYCMSR